MHKHMGSAALGAMGMWSRSALSVAIIVGLGLATAPASAVRQVAATAPALRVDAESVARSYLQRNLRQFGLDAGDVREASLSSIVPGTAPGVRHVYLQQNFRGIPVWNGIITINVLGDGRVLAPGSRFIGKLAAKAGNQNARTSSVEAAESAADFLELKLKRPFRVVGRAGGPMQRTTLSDGGIASAPIQGELVWFYARDLRQLRLAWRVQIAETGGQHVWNTFVDAGTGEALHAEDRVVHDQAAAIAGGISHPMAAFVAATGAVIAAPPALSTPFASIDGSSYTVYPLPYESPTDGTRVVVSGAANPAASPYGWHDTNGAPGAEATTTRGNNVQAYVDADGNNIADPGSDPDGGAGLDFAFPMLAGQVPADHRPAAVTNLFYWNNIIHDVAYAYGFNEAAGNFQFNNYGKGGAGGDYVRAEAQDGSGTDNANFDTPPDGSRPRMQMYQWTFPFPNVVKINSPAAIAGNYIATGAGFGPTLATAGARTGGLVLVNDGTGTGSDACEALVGFPAGAVALLDRGSCTFVIKVKNAQDAGASAVVSINNVAGDPITMGGTDATITIPAAMISLADGNLLKANLPANATVQANGTPPANRDSDFDAGVIVHEYGHGISNRLTGGPANTSCLVNEEQMGEGWSDWFAMTLTTRASDVATTRRGTATYLSYQRATGVGIRPTQYSTDMAVNPSTYASVANATAISSPHGIGYVWTSMLWEVYWNLVNRYGYNPDIYAGWNTGGNNLAFQLVMDGMKMQPCTPGFVDGRDAILAADTALTGGANKCEIWRGFAKRGLGFGASQGAVTDRLDGVQAFDLPAVCATATFGGFQAPANPAPALNVVNTGQVIPVTFTLSGVAGLPQLDTQAVNCNTLAPSGEVPSALSSASGLQKSGSNYSIAWRPNKIWAGTCRAVTVRIPAASDAVAYFRFAEITPQTVKPNH